MHATPLKRGFAHLLGLPRRSDQRPLGAPIFYRLWANVPAASSRSTPLRYTSAPKGLRISAQGQPSLGEATLGMTTHNREANPAPSLHTPITSSVGKKHRRTSAP